MRLGEADPYADSDDDTPAYRVRSSPLPAVSPIKLTLPSLRKQAKKVGEVEVQPGFSLSQQIGIAIACLVDENDSPLVEIVKEVRSSPFSLSLLSR
jgi:replication fork protection complex subunit Tof1/Swi1